MSSQSNAASSSSTLRTVFGRWGKVAFAERDLEAQTIVGAREHFLDIALPAPPAAYTHAPRTLPSQTEVDEEEGTDPVDDFFGVVRPSHPLRPVAGSQDSRHDAAHALVHHDDVPPPYTYASEPPAYSRVAEYPTLAMYLFKLGFRKSLLYVVERKLRRSSLPYSLPAVLASRRPHPHLAAPRAGGLGALQDGGGEAGADRDDAARGGQVGEAMPARALRVRSCRACGRFDCGLREAVMNAVYTKKTRPSSFAPACHLYLSSSSGVVSLLSPTFAYRPHSPRVPPDLHLD